MKNTKKRILVLGINFRPEMTGIGKYTGEMVDWLVDHEYECTVITSFPYYPNWKVQAPYHGKFYKKEVEQEGRLKIYRCPMYVPGSPSGAKRILQEISFFMTSFVFLCYLLFKRGHESILCMAPPFHLGFLALFYRFFKGGRILYHVQDLQIEAAKELRLIKIKGLVSGLFALEKYLLKRMDHVSTISEGMLRKMKAKTAKEVLLFPNWVDMEAFYPMPDRKKVLKLRWGFREEDILVVYSGSIGEKQGLERLVPIAKSLEKFEAIKFIICGDGPYQRHLKQLANEQGACNLFFLPLQPNGVFNDFLNMSDVHLVLQKASASDLVMPSKLTTILAVGGLALVTAETGSTLHSILKEFEMGIVVDEDNEVHLRTAIMETCLQSNARFRRNARRYAENFLDRERILPDVIQKIQGSDSDLVSWPSKIVLGRLDSLRQ